MRVWYDLLNWSLILKRPLINSLNRLTWDLYPAIRILSTWINISTNVANTSVFYEREFPTPADPSLKLTVDHCCCKTSEDSAYMTDKYYRSLLGSLLYVAMWTRPDILIRLSSVPVFLIYTLGPCTLESSSTHRWVSEKDRYSWFCLR